MKSVKLVLDRLLAVAIGLLMAAMVLNVLWQVLTRYVLPTPSSYTEELARYMMIWIGLLGGAYGVGQKSHLALDLLTARVTGARRRLLEIFIALAVLAFAVAVLIGGGGRLVWITFALGQTSAALQLPTGFVYLVVPVSGLCTAFYTVGWLIDARRGEAAAAQQSGALN